MPLTTKNNLTCRVEKDKTFHMRPGSDGVFSCAEDNRHFIRLKFG